MKKTNFTYGKRRELDVKASSKLKVSLWLGLFFLFMGMSAYTYAQTLGCNIVTQDLVNISVGSDGQHFITVADVLQNASGSCGPLEVVVYDKDGNEIDSLVDCSSVGDTLKVCVYEQGAAHGNCHDCCTKAVICDLMPPIVECVNDTITCLETADPPFPIATDNCSDPEDITFEVLSEEHILIDCDPEFIGAVVRVIKAVDAAGNESAECNDTLFTERFDISEVDMPDSLTSDRGTALICDGSNWEDLNGNGYPDPGEPGVGAPTYRGMDVFPIPPALCCVFFDVKDVVIQCPLCDCSTKKIMRTYTAYEWWCGTEVSQSYIQVIEIVDTTGPKVVAPDDFTISANNTDCTATAVIPAATVTEDCSEIVNYYVEYPGGFQTLTEPQAVVVDLPVGENVIYLKAYNGCYLEGIDSMVITVLDEAPPIAVCVQYGVASLGIDGTARAYAASFDNGSHDNCAIGEMEVRRVGGICGSSIEDTFGPYVEFCCNDLGTPVEVEFRVYDASGNSNTCIVEVEVQDKIQPIIKCPSDFSISCVYPIDLNDLSEFGTIRILSDINDKSSVEDIVIDVDPFDTEQGPEVVGQDGYAFDNCSVTIEESHTLERNECGRGTLVRIFTAKNSAGDIVATCTQTISIVDFNPFGQSDIHFPPPVSISSKCYVEELTPDYLQSQGYQGYPEYDEGPCDLLAHSYTDQVFDFDGTGSDACFKILRTWKVLDCCTPSDDPLIYTGTQMIKVFNNVAPVFTGNCDDITLASTQEDCDSRYIELLQYAEDDCLDAEDLNFTWKIDLDNNGTFDLSGTGNNASGDYGVGTHRILWTVSDNCSNVSSCQYTFTVLNEKAGTPIAYNGISVDLMPVDTNNDGEIDNGTVTIGPEILDAGSYHACGFDFTLSFSSDPTDVTRTYTCDDVGKVDIELWIHSSNGTKAHVRTYILVQANDPSEPCGPGNTGPGSLVGGTITTSYNSRIPNVSVALEGVFNRVVTTNGYGEYSFGGVSDNADYTVNPKYEEGILNGVSTWDLTLIQQHMLGLSEITDPYLLIAADINNDRRITVVDLVDLRKTILGLNEGFPNNSSWRFIDKEYTFDGEGNAILNENFPEMHKIVNLDKDLYDLNFVGVKVGDINGNVSLTAEDRNVTQIVAAIQNAEFSAGEIVEVPVKANDVKDVLALQYSMNYNASLLEFKGMKSGILELEDENFAVLDEGLVTMSWNDVKSHKLNENETLFTMVFRANQAGILSEALNFNDAVTKSLVVDNNEEKRFSVEFRGLKSSAYALYQNTPNPVEGTTVIGISLPRDIEGTLTFYDLNGKVLKTVEKTFNRGYNEVSIQKADLNVSGVVLYKFSSNEFSATKKMIILN